MKNFFKKFFSSSSQTLLSSLRGAGATKQSQKRFTFFVFAFRPVSCLPAVVLTAACLLSLVSAPSAHAIVGPSTSAGVGQGAIGVDTSYNLSIGTSTTQSDTKLLIVGTSTTSGAGSSYFAIKVLDVNRGPLFIVRGDGSVTIGSNQIYNTQTTTSTIGSTVGTPPSNGALFVNGPIFANGPITTYNTLQANNYSGTISGANVTAGVFATGNFAFPSSLGIGTSTQVGLPQPLSVYGGGYFSGNVGIGGTSPQRTLSVYSGTADSQVTIGSVGPSLSLTNAGSGSNPNTASMTYISALATVAGQYSLNAGDFMIGGIGASRGNLILNSNYSGAGTTNVILQPSTGNVGIGTTSPGAKLSVVGNGTGLAHIGTNGCGSNFAGITLGATVDSACTTYNLLGGDGNLYIDRPSGGYIAFRSGNGDQVRIDPNGNVGIGTTGPTGLLTVGSAMSGTANSSIFTTNAGALGGTATNELKLASIGFTTGNQEHLGIYGYRASTGADWTTTGIGLGIDVDNTTRVGGVQLFFHSNGNVGIGTTAPGQKLSVAGTIESTSGGFKFPDATTQTTAYLGGSQTITAGNVTAGVFGSNQGNGNFAMPASFGVATSSQTGLPQSLSVYGGGYFSGNVGIGTASPISWSKLDVNGALSLSGIGDAGNSLALVTSEAGGRSLELKARGGSNPDLVVATTGNVGIGTTNPSSTLTVAGTIRTTSGGIAFPDNTTQTTAYLGGSQTVTAGNVSAGTFGSNTGNGNYTFPGTVTGASQFIVTTSGNPGGSGFLMPYAGSSPNSGPAVRWSDGTLANTFGLYVSGGLWFQGNNGNSSFGIRQYTGTGSLGTVVTQFAGDASSASYINASGGNVGIGTASPDYKLDVGTKSATQSATAGAGGLIRNNMAADTSPFTQARLIVYGGTNMDAGNWGYFAYGSDASMREVYGNTSNGGPLLWGTSNAMDGTGTFSPTMSLTRGGNLGINMAVPGQKLSVAGGSMAFTAGGLPNPVVGIGNTQAAAQAELAGFYTYDTTSGYQGWIGGIGVGGEAGSWGVKTLRFQVPDGGGNVVNALNILGGTGNVGIGTTAPAAASKLTLYSTDYPLLQFNSNWTGAPSSTNGFQIGIDPTNVGQINNKSGALVLSASNVEVMRMTAGGGETGITGNLSIGAGSPSPAHLAVVGSFNGPLLFISGNAYGDNSRGAEIKLTNTNMSTNKFIRIDGSNNLQILNSGYTAAIMGFADNGNGTIAGCLNYNGGTLGTCLSDEKLKKNINPYNIVGLKDIIRLNPVTYQYNGLANTPTDNNIRTGLVAQQVQQVAPALVSATYEKLRLTDTAPTKLLEVDYNALTFGMVNAIKELNAKVESILNGTADSIKKVWAEIASVKDALLNHESRITQLEKQNADLLRIICSDHPQDPSCRK